MTAKQILEMIETVDPSDTAKLDEIDARVVCYLANRDYLSHGIWKKRLWVWIPAWIQDFPYRQVVEYTRSRDALKAIRPEGWRANIEPRFATDRKPEGEEYYAYLLKADYSRYSPVDLDWMEQVKSPLLSTEELAELHAIISAIAYERGEG